MLKKLIPVVLVLIGLGGGVGAGLALRDSPEEDGSEDLAETMVGPCGDAVQTTEAKTVSYEAADTPEKPTDFLKLPDQFIIPVVDGDRVKSLVVMSLTLEIDEAAEDGIYNRLPKLRDGFLRVMLDHSNSGGFDGPFTSNGSMDSLRRGFLEVAKSEFPESVYDVLILDINRQDLG